MKGLRQMAGGNPKKALARKFFESQQAEALLSIVAHQERRIVQGVRDLQGALDVDDVAPIEEIPSADDRVEQIRGLALAMVDEDLPAWWVANIADIENAEEAAQYAALDAAGWETTKETWAANYREQGVEGTDHELATAHVRARFDAADLATFEEIVVDWDDDRRRAVLEDVLAGGFALAEDRLEAMTEAVQEDSDDR